jgi:hypothetical protein
MNNNHMEDIMSATQEQGQQVQQPVGAIPFVIDLTARVMRRHRLLDEIAQNRLNRAHVTEMMARYQELADMLDGQHKVLQESLKVR